MIKNKKSKIKNQFFVRVSFDSEKKQRQALKEKLEKWIKEMGGRNGVKNRPAHDSPKPFVDNVEKQIHFEVQQALAKTDATHHQAYNHEKNKRSSVGDDSETSKAGKASPTVERAASIAAIKNQSALLKTRDEELEREAIVREGEINGLVEKIGSRPYKKKWASKVSYILIAAVISCGEFPINASALLDVSDTMPLILSYVTAGFLSLVGAGVAHYLGKGIAWKIARDERTRDQEAKDQTLIESDGFFSKENVEVSAPLFFGITLLGMIFLLRWEHNDWYLSFINVGLIGVATLLAYYHTDPTPWRKEYEGQVRARNHIQKQRAKIQKELVKFQSSTDRLQLVSQEEEIKRQETLATDDLENIGVSQQEYHIWYEALYRSLIEIYRNANTNARLDSGVPIVGFWDAFDQEYLPELTFNPIITNNQK